MPANRIYLRKRRRSNSLRVRRTSGVARRTNLLTRTNKQIIYEAIRIGMPFVRACCLAGISSKSAANLRKYGKHKQNRLYYDFYNRCLRIEAKRELEALAVIRNVAKGGDTFTETKIKTQGKQIVETITTTKQLLPEWKAAAWYTERRDKIHFGKDQLEDRKTPEELAEEIRNASIAIWNTIPTQPSE